MFDSYKPSLHGKVEWKCTRAQAWVITTSLLYALLSAMTIIYAMHSPLAYAVPCVLAVAFFIWRIHRIHAPVAIACDHYFLVLAPGKWDKSGGLIALLFHPVYYVAEYPSIAGFSDRWSEMYIGSRSEGGMVKVPVPLAFVTRANKERICEIIERKQRNGGASRSFTNFCDK